MAMQIFKFVFERPDFNDLKNRAFELAHKHAGTAAMAWFLRERIPHRFDRTMETALLWEHRKSSESRRGKLSRAFNPVTRRYEVGDDFILKSGFRAPYHVWSGKTKARFKAARIFTTKQRMGLEVTGLNPGYGRKKPGSRRIDLRSEIQRIVPPEYDEIAKIYRGEFIKFLTTNPRARAKKKTVSP